jgi:hypothetical protein
MALAKYPRAPARTKAGAVIVARPTVAHVPCTRWCRQPLSGLRARGELLHPRRRTRWRPCERGRRRERAWSTQRVRWSAVRRRAGVRDRRQGRVRAWVHRPRRQPASAPTAGWSPRVTVCEGSIIGERVLLHPGPSSAAKASVSRRMVSAGYGFRRLAEYASAMMSRSAPIRLSIAARSARR